MNIEKKQEIAAEFQRWLKDNCITLDTETTGLDGGAEVVEISMIDAHGQILLDTLVKPSKPIPEEATNIHGITNDMVASAPSWADIHDDVVGIMAGRTVVVYNAAFDTRLMVQSAQTVLSADKIQELEGAMSGVVCAMLKYAEFYGDWNEQRGNYRWQRLEAAARQQGVTVDGTAHRALCDVKTTLGVVRSVASMVAG